MPHQKNLLLPALAAGVIALLLLLSGCATLIAKPEQIAWHNCYREIDCPEALAFLQRGIDRLQSSHGQDLEFAIRQVMLRQSIKTAAAARYAIAEHFSLTETIDGEAGIFCIYIAVAPTHPKFYYLLGHEIGHLRRPSLINDADEEQFCNEFSRQLCQDYGYAWRADWETRAWVRQHRAACQGAIIPHLPQGH